MLTFCQTEWLRYGGYIYVKCDSRHFGSANSLAIAIWSKKGSVFHGCFHVIHVYRAAFRQPGDSALGVVGGGSAPTPPNCRLEGLRNVGLWASPGLRLMIAVGKYYY